MLYSIQLIRRRCIPPKILKTVIGRVPIRVVARLHTGGARTYESLKDKTVNFILPATAALVQTHNEPPGAVHA